MFPAMYSVYRKPDDTPVAIHKNRLQCAAAMGVKVNSFDSIASNIRNGKIHKTWEIIRCDEEEEEE